MAFDLADFDPLGNEDEHSSAEKVANAPADSPFSAALRGTSQPESENHSSSPLRSAHDVDLLINFATSPPRPVSTPLLVLPLHNRDSFEPTPSSPPAVPRAQTTLLDDSFDGIDTTSVANTPFASLSPPPTVRRAPPPPPETDQLARPAPTRPVGRRWSIMNRLQAEKRRTSGKGLSPVKDCSPLKEGDSSMFLSPQHLGAADMSLIADEGGSFLLHEAEETTLNRSVMSEVFEVSEEPSEGVSTLLRGLGESTINSARFPSSKSTPALSTIFSAAPSPTSLSQSTGPFLSAAPLAVEPSFALDNPSPTDATFLNSSTASFKEYRDSPVKSRIVSILAEHWIAEEDELEDDGKTGRPPVRKFGRESGASDMDSGTEEGPSSSSFDFTQWQTGEVGTGILNQSPPTAALLAQSMCSVELAQSAAHTASPLDSPVSALASSTRTVVPEPSQVAALRSPGTAITPVRTSANETGAERLRRRMEELRAQKNGGAPSAAPAKAPTPAATPDRRLSLRPLAAAAPRPAPLARPRYSTLPLATPARSRLVGTTATAEPPKTPGERKESTAARLDRLRSERKQREETRAKSPEKPAVGLKRTSSLSAAATRAPPGSVPLARKSVADLRAARVASAALAATAGKLPARRTSTVSAPSRPVGRPSLAPSASRLPLAPSTSRPSLAPLLSRPSLAPSASRTSLAPASSLASSTSSTSSNVTVTAGAAPRKTASARPSLQPGATGLKRPSLAKPTFSAVPLPRARQPLGQTQPGASSAAAQPLKAGVSRIGLGRAG
ncbi:proteophosphoglycan ppg4 [Rhodotorula toruloides]|uniref:Proteophosphoglycan ppg4 n=1 Tax=Rhodotorula toruloides TaxID=5286 RepID=A0A511KG03_RHOTO|nr:proteophosphoglycan ppg4 [Rhodotorula toruloides]